MTSIQLWLSAPAFPHRSPRMEPENLVAYYWTGGVPSPNLVRDISLCGARIAAPDRFYLGTAIQIVLENRAAAPTDGAGSPHTCVYAKVIRYTSDGFCVKFGFEDARARYSFRRFLRALRHRNGEGSHTGGTAMALGSGVTE